MKTFQEFLEEGSSSEKRIQTKPQNVLNKISSAYRLKYPGLNLDTSHNLTTDHIRVNQIWIPPHFRGRGIGTRIMKGLGKYANKTQRSITLNQQADPGKKQKLSKFYKTHGFVPNRGRNKDFTTRDAYIRKPN